MTTYKYTTARAYLADYYTAPSDWLADAADAADAGDEELADLFREAAEAEEEPEQYREKIVRAIRRVWSERERQADVRERLLSRLDEVASTADRIDGHACYNDGQDRWVVTEEAYDTAVRAIRTRIEADEYPTEEGHPAYPIYQSLCDETQALWSQIGSCELTEAEARESLPADVLDWLGIDTATTATKES